MNLFRRIASAAAALTLLVTSLLFGLNMAPAIAAGGKVYQAEELPGDASSRTVLEDRILIDPAVHTAGNSMVINQASMAAGTHRLVFVMSLQSETKSIYDNIFEIRVYGNKGNGKELIFTNWLTPNLFAMLNKMQTAVCGIVLGDNLTDVEIQLYYSCKFRAEVDKVALLDEGDYYFNQEAELDYTQLESSCVKAGEGILAPAGPRSGCFASVVTSAGNSLAAGRQVKAVVHMRILNKIGYTDYNISAIQILADGIDRGTTYLNESHFSEVNEYTAIEVPLTLPADTAALTVWVWAGVHPDGVIVPFEVDRIEICDADLDLKPARDNAYTREAELTLGGDNTRAVTTDGQGIEIDPAVHTAGYAVFGNFITLRPGTYRITHRMKIAGRSATPGAAFAELDIYGQTADVREAVTAIHVRDAQFAALDEWTDVDFWFTIDKPMTTAEFRLRAFGDVKFQVDKYTIHKYEDTAPWQYRAINSPQSNTGAFTAGGIASANGSAADWMTWGSNLILEPGKYDIRIHARQTGNPAAAQEPIFLFKSNFYVDGRATTDFVSTFHQSDFPAVGEAGVFTVPIEVYGGLRQIQTQLMVKYLGRSDLVLENYEIVRTGHAGTPYAVAEAESLAGQDNTRSITAEGEAVEHDPATHDNGCAIYGTQINFVPGTYKVSARVKLLSRPASPADIVAEFDLCSYAQGAEHRTAVTAVRSGDFPALGEWTDIDFHLKTGVDFNAAQIRMWVQGKAKIQVDKFVVTKLDDSAPLVIQAEHTPQNLTGTFTAGGIACVEGDRADWVTTGPSLILDSGKYALKIYAKQTAKAADAGAEVFRFQMNYRSGIKDYLDTHQAVFKQSDFPATVEETGVFTVPFEVYEDERFINIQLMLRYEGHSAVEFDRYEIVRTDNGGTRPEEPYFVAEAERMGRNTGFEAASGIVFIKGMGDTIGLYGTTVDIPAGNWRMVVYAKLLSTSGNPDMLAFKTYINARPGGVGDPSALYATEIIESRFAAADTYYPIVIPISTAVDLPGAELCMLYPNNLNIKVDKIMLLQEGFPVPDAEQESGGNGGRPAGTPAHDRYDVPLTDENILFSSANTGRIADGSIRFAVENNLPGSVQGFSEPVYMTDGEKTARLYLRTPKQVTGSINGSFYFLEVLLLENGTPIAIKTFSAQHFYAHTNTPYILDIPFTADENKGMSVAVKWNGNYTLCVDKIVFTDTADSDIKTHDLAMTHTADASRISVDSDMLGSFHTIDTVRLTTREGYVAKIPVAYFREWLRENSSVDIAFTAAGRADSDRIAGLMAGFEGTRRDIALFHMAVTLKSSDGDTMLGTIPTLIDIEIPVDDALVTGNSPAAVGWIIQNDGTPFASDTRLAGDIKTVLLRTGRMGAQYVGILTDYVSENPSTDPGPDPTGTDNPDPVKTGVAGMGGALGILVAGTAGITAVSRKKKRSA